MSLKMYIEVYDNGNCSDEQRTKLITHIEGDIVKLNQQLEYHKRLLTKIQNNEEMNT